MIVPLRLPSPTVTLGELLPADGLQVVRDFAFELRDGKHHGRAYLDIHADLRTKLEPYKGYYSQRGITDDDYFVLVILNSLGIRGAGEFLQ